MELRVLRYFLAAAEEGSILGAAERLHISQSALSKQLRDIEDELGKPLLIRGNRGVTLTPEGIYLRKRAEEILEMVQKTERALSCSDAVEGDVSIGTGETSAVPLLVEAAARLQKESPGIRCHFSSGDAFNIAERIDKGLIDFGVLLDPANLMPYEYMLLPCKEAGGVLMRKDTLLAAKKTISPEDLWDKPLLLARQHQDGGMLSAWMGKKFSRLHVVGTYTMLYNCVLMVAGGLGYAVCREGAMNLTESSGLCFRPLEPRQELGMSVVWKRGTPLTRAAEKYLQVLRGLVNNG